ncbi:hypothetical protein [Methanosphaerula palustris]|uniref:hypothetical protein n=1 Tax=Methanosphaerula palustris TaxID=475088 RepID=UPI0013051DC0|nr:hypothetical protein [Methanosphaerula palustris]
METCIQPGTVVLARQRHDGNRPSLSANSKDAETTGKIAEVRPPAVNRISIAPSAALLLG